MTNQNQQPKLTPQQIEAIKDDRIMEEAIASAELAGANQQPPIERISSETRPTGNQQPVECQSSEKNPTGNNKPDDEWREEFKRICPTNIEIGEYEFDLHPVAETLEKFISSLISQFRQQGYDEGIQKGIELFIDLKRKFHSSKFINGEKQCSMAIELLNNIKNNG